MPFVTEDMSIHGVGTNPLWIIKGACVLEQRRVTVKGIY